MERDNTARLFGIYKINALSASEYNKARWIVKGLSLALFLLILYLLNFYVLSNFEVPFNPIAYLLLYVNIFVSSALLSLGALKIVSFYGLRKPLSRVNADHLLSGFNLDRGRLRSLAKKDINANGYFSAYGYWDLYFNTSKHVGRKRIQERRALKTQYPDVFNESNETE